MFRILIKYILQILITFIVLVNISYAAGGIALGATRLIYSQDKKQASMPIINSTSDKRFLINAWVEDSSAKTIKSVIVTPPMLVSEPKAENSLRIVNTDQSLVQDRETLYYLNVQAIPSVSKKELEEKNNVLQLAILSRIKVMMRPTKLAIQIDEAPNLLTVSRLNNKLIMRNPTPYFMTIINLSVDGVEQEGLMLAPFSEMALNKTGSTILFQTINDYGAFTQQTKIDIQ